MTDNLGPVYPQGVGPSVLDRTQNVGHDHPVRYPLSEGAANVQPPPSPHRDRPLLRSSADQQKGRIEGGELHRSPERQVRWNARRPRAKDIERIRDEHPEWPLWEELYCGKSEPRDFERMSHIEEEDLRTGRYVDSYGVSWG
jgi:hypothetical protein